MTIKTLQSIENEFLNGDIRKADASMTRYCESIGKRLSQATSKAKPELEQVDEELLAAAQCPFENSKVE